MAYYYCAQCSDTMEPEDAEDGMCPWCDEEMELVPEEGDDEDGTNEDN